MWLRTTPADKSTAGFTIIEALVALAVVAIILPSIAPLMALSNRGVRSVEQHIALVLAARTIEHGLPDRELMLPGSLSGQLAGDRWRVDILPFTAGALNGGSPSPWMPLTVVITVRSPSGATWRLDTVRLRRGSSEGIRNRTIPAEQATRVSRS